MMPLKWELAKYSIRHIFCDFGLGGEFCDFCDVFITINSHMLKWKFARGLTREIRENKTTAKIITYIYTVRPNKKETRFISEISSLPRKIETNYMLYYQEHFLFFHLIPNT